MRILIANSLYFPHQAGGAERSVKLLVDGLKRADHEVAVVTATEKGSLQERIVQGVRVWSVPAANIYWSFQTNHQDRMSLTKTIWHAVESANLLMTPALKTIIRLFRPDIVHTNNLYELSISVWEAARQENVPVVHTLRDYYLLCPKSMFDEGKCCTSQCLKCKPFAFPRRLFSQIATAVVGISAFILRQHRKHSFFPSADIRRVIPNPIRLVDNEENGERSASRNILRIGFIGRLVEHKGIGHLLEVVDNMQDPNVILKVAGSGPLKYVQSLKSSYESKNIQFLGYVRPEDFYSVIDVLVVPSLWNEPFGRVVVEAYMYGVPVITTDRGGMPELVEEGRTGFVFNPDNEGELVEIVEQLKAEAKSLDRMSALAREKSKVYSVDSCVEQYESVYRETLIS